MVAQFKVVHFGSGASTAVLVHLGSVEPYGVLAEGVDAEAAVVGVA